MFAADITVFVIWLLNNLVANKHYNTSIEFLSPWEYFDT